jgi:hypothetical protein
MAWTFGPSYDWLVTVADGGPGLQTRISDALGTLVSIADDPTESDDVTLRKRVGGVVFVPAVRLSPYGLRDDRDRPHRVPRHPPPPTCST